MREAVAMTPIEAAVIKSMTMQVITVAPVLLLVACRKTSMNGNPVGVASASSMLPRQNKMASYLWSAFCQTVQPGPTDQHCESKHSIEN